jgi:hypothetical protein
MLEEDVKEGGVAFDLRREEEIARGGGKLRVDKTATRQAQRGPVSAASDIARQVTIEKCHVANKICISSHFEILSIDSLCSPFGLPAAVFLR